MARKKRPQKRTHVDSYANIARIMPSNKSSSNNSVDVAQTIREIREAAKYRQGGGSIEGLQKELAAKQNRERMPQPEKPEDKWPEYK